MINNVVTGILYGFYFNISKQVVFFPNNYVQIVARKLSTHIEHFSGTRKVKKHVKSSFWGKYAMLNMVLS